MIKPFLKRPRSERGKPDVVSITGHSNDDLVQIAFTRSPEKNEPDYGLCDVCNLIDFDAIFSKKSYPDHEEKTVLIRRQPVSLFQPGCQTCNLFARIMAGWHRPEYQTGFLLRATVYQYQVSLEVGPIAQESADYPRKRIMFESFDRRALEHVCTSTDAREDGTPLPQKQTNNEIEFAWLAAEIQHCVRDHDHPPPLVGDSGDEMMLVVDCIERQVVKINSKADYLCLSYVWGHRPAGVTTENPYLDEGYLKQVPAAIEDAMKVVLNLGERYLWVDRYCISQLDPEAKAVEMEAMPWIFAGAKVTIVALGLDNEVGLRGISMPREPSPHAHTAQGRLYHINDRTVNEVDRSAWITRAWTLQEAVLAKRLILFLSSDTVFVCKTSMLFQMDFRVTRQSEERSKRWEPHFVDFDSAFSAYTTRTLTYESDSLAAFCGFLKAFKKPCYWGVPASSATVLLEDLDPLEAGFIENLRWMKDAWRQSHRPVLTQRRQYLSAPTWSWVSCRPFAQPPKPTDDSRDCMIHACSVRFWGQDLRWCSAPEFFAVRTEPQPVVELGPRSILLTGVYSLFQAKYSDPSGLFLTCCSSRESPTFDIFSFEEESTEFHPDLRELMPTEEYDQTYSFMPRIEAVLLSVQEENLDKLGVVVYRTFWLTLEVGEKREDGITPATRTGLIEATFGHLSRLEVKELLASLDGKRVTYELS